MNIKNHRVILSTDYDADGIISSVIGIKAFDILNIKYEHIILNNKYPRGVSEFTVEKVLDLTTADEEFIFLTADHGSSSTNALNLLKKKRPNSYIIITDHHIIPDEKLLENICDEIYNPFYTKCNYNKNLSGAGVLHKYFEKILDYTDWHNLKPYVVMANLIDQMDMNDENNISLYKQTQNMISELEFIQAMLKITKKSIPHDRWILINLGPLLNSSHRMGQPEVAVRAMLGDRNSITKLDILNRERKKKTNELVDFLKPQIKVTSKSLDKMMMLIMPQNALSSLSGLVAGKIGNEQNKPTFVFKLEDNTLKGSARAIQELPLLDIYSFIKSKVDNVILEYGGHNMANGLKLNFSPSAIDNFIKYFNIYLIENNIKYIKSIEAEIIDARDINKKVSWIEQNRPFGNKKPYPYIEIKDLEILRIVHFRALTILYLTNGIEEYRALFFKENCHFNIDLTIDIKGYIENDDKTYLIIDSYKQYALDKGIEISSYSNSSLGRILTNVHYNRQGKSLFDIKMDNLKDPIDVLIPDTEISYFSKYGYSVESWYKSNNSLITLGKIDDNYDFNLMVKLIQTKLIKYNLTYKISSELLQYSTHNVGKGRWSSRGNNMFIEALKSAFIYELFGTKTIKTKNGYIRVYEKSQDIVDIGFHTSLSDELEQMFKKYNFVSWKNGRHKAIAFGDIEYEYTGAKHKPQKPDYIDSPIIKNILNKASEVVGRPFDYYNHILINRFDNCGIGTHTDDEDLYQDKNGNVGPVLIVSIGDTLTPHIIDGVKILAYNNSVVEMSTGKLKHSVGNSDGIRYSITFRHIPK